MEIYVAAKNSLLEVLIDNQYKMLFHPVGSCLPVTEEACHHVKTFAKYTCMSLVSFTAVGYHLTIQTGRVSIRVIHYRWTMNHEP